MCEFHNQISRVIAADPLSGKLDFTRYCLSHIALGGFWVDRRLPETPYLSGASNYDMATPQAQAALWKSGLDTNLDRIQHDRAALVPMLRTAIDEVIHDRELTLQALNLPAKPLGFPRPLILMNEALHEGPADIARPIVAHAKDPAHEPMRKAVATLMSRPGVADAFEHLIDDSIAELMVKAPSATNARLQKIFDSIPQRVRSAVTECTMHGGGGALATHALCLGGMAASGGAGAALMGPAMYVGAPALAMGIETYVNWRNGAKASVTRLAAAAAVSFGIAAGINQLLPHEHDHMHNEKAEWFESLPRSIKDSQMQSQKILIAALPASLQKEVKEAAKNEGLLPEVFLLTCDGTDPVVAKVNAYQQEIRAEAPSIALR